MSPPAASQEAEIEHSGSHRRALVAVVALLAVAGFGVLRSAPHVPANGAMLWGFGREVDYQSCGFHTGQDWFAPAGTPVYAIADGIVVYVGPLWQSGPGVGRGDFAIVLDHGDYYTTYSHNRVALVVAGERVVRGQAIAEIGNEGYSKSPHLHLEKVVAPFSGDWRQPFAGCDGYQDPGLIWSPF